MSEYEYKYTDSYSKYRKKRGKGRPGYPWDQWFSGPEVTLIQGVHYRCSTESMKGIVRNAAVKRRLQVSVKEFEMTNEYDKDVHSGIRIVVKGLMGDKRRTRGKGR